MRPSLAAIVLTVALGTPTFGAALAQERQLTFRAGVERVTLSATVRTRQGRPVMDLGVHDFDLFDAGEARQISEFRADEGPVRLAMLMDVSGSMDLSAKRASAQEAAWHLLSWLTAGRDEVGLYAFDRSIVELQAPAPSPGQIIEKIESLRPYGETSLFDAIAETGGAIAKQGAGRRAVVVLTDGADNSSRLTPSEVSGIASSVDVPVYIVIIVSPFDQATKTAESEAQIASWREGPMADLARWTGGDLFTVSGPAQSSLAARQIVTELRQQYLIAFAPGPRPGWHPIELRTRNKDLVVRTRSGYVVSRSGTQGR